MPKERTGTERTAFWIMLLSTVPLIMHAVSGLFSRFMADDYCYAAISDRLGFFDAQVFWYNNWTGRFFFNFFATLPAVLGESSVRYSPMIGIAAWWLALFFALRRLPGNLFLSRTLRGATSSFALMFLFQEAGETSSLHISYPLLEDALQLARLNIYQSLYWHSAWSNYLLGLVGLTLSSGLMSMSRSLAVPGLAVIGFLVAGVSELIGVLQIALILFFFLQRSTRSRKKNLLAWLIGAILGFGLVFFAPGNDVRLGDFPAPDLDAFLFLKTVLIQTGLFFVGIAFSSPFTLIAWTVYFLWLGVNSSTQKGSNFRLLLLISFFCVGYVTICFGASNLMLRGPLPSRAVIVPRIIVNALVAYWGISIGLQLRLTALHRFKKILDFLLIFLISVSAIRSSIHIVAELPGRAKSSSIWDSCDGWIRRTKEAGAESVVVTPFDTAARKADLGVISADSDFWINQCVADYYGLKSIVMDPNAGNCLDD